MDQLKLMAVTYVHIPLNYQGELCFCVDKQKERKKERKHLLAAICSSLTGATKATGERCRCE